MAADPSSDDTQTQRSQTDTDGPRGTSTGVRISVPMASGVLDPQQPLRSPASQPSARGAGAAPGDEADEPDAGHSEHGARDESPETDPRGQGAGPRGEQPDGPQGVSGADMDKRGTNRSEWRPGEPCPVCDGESIGALELQENNYSVSDASMRKEASGDVYEALEYWCKECGSTLYQHPAVNELFGDARYR